VACSAAGEKLLLDAAAVAEQAYFIAGELG
jgi:hypothetical protein